MSHILAAGDDRKAATINIEKYIKISYIYTAIFLTEISSCFTVSDLVVATIV